MRTTLTLDDDVANRLERLRRSRNASFREIVNDALRRGLDELTTPPKRDVTFRTRSVDQGGLRLASIDNVGETLAIAEGEAFK
jgi:hypothetical protein